MSKLKKIIEAQAVITGSKESTLKRLNRLLSAKDIAALGKELELFNTAHNLLSLSIQKIDPEFKAKLDRLLAK